MRWVSQARALRRSWLIYFSAPGQNPALDALYSRHVGRSDLVFDIGAHVGHRTASFLRLGARVVAVEPQALPALLIRAVWGWRGAKVVHAACGSGIGVATMHLNADNPIVSTMSREFVAAARCAPGWEGQLWNRGVEVRLTTLDTLIAAHGRPAFVKIDVEGFEAEVLAGLTQRVRALSFEFTSVQRNVAIACINRCEALKFPRFNAVLGETHEYVFKEDVDAAGILKWLMALPGEASSGDIYAS